MQVCVEWHLNSKCCKRAHLLVAPLILEYRTSLYHRFRGKRTWTQGSSSSMEDMVQCRICIECQRPMLALQYTDVDSRTSKRRSEREEGRLLLVHVVVAASKCNATITLARCTSCCTGSDVDVLDHSSSQLTPINARRCSVCATQSSVIYIFSINVRYYLCLM